MSHIVHVRSCIYEVCLLPVFDTPHRAQRSWENPVLWCISPCSTITLLTGVLEALWPHILLNMQQTSLLALSSMFMIVSPSYSQRGFLVCFLYQSLFFSAILYQLLSIIQLGFFAFKAFLVHIKFLCGIAGSRKGLAVQTLPSINEI